VEKRSVKLDARSYKKEVIGCKRYDVICRYFEVSDRLSTASFGTNLNLEAVYIKLKNRLGTEAVLSVFFTWN
jgi:hypothetical protein